MAVVRATISSMFYKRSALNLDRPTPLVFHSRVTMALESWGFVVGEAGPWAYVALPWELLRGLPEHMRVSMLSRRYAALQWRDLTLSGFRLVTTGELLPDLMDHCPMFSAVTPLLHHVESSAYFYWHPWALGGGKGFHLELLTSGVGRLRTLDEVPSLPFARMLPAGNLALDPSGQYFVFNEALARLLAEYGFDGGLLQAAGTYAPHEDAYSVLRESAQGARPFTVYYAREKAGEELLFQALLQVALKFGAELTAFLQDHSSTAALKENVTLCGKAVFLDLVLKEYRRIVSREKQRDEHYKEPQSYGDLQNIRNRVGAGTVLKGWGLR